MSPGSLLSVTSHPAFAIGAQKTETQSWTADSDESLSLLPPYMQSVSTHASECCIAIALTVLVECRSLGETGTKNFAIKTAMQPRILIRPYEKSRTTPFLIESPRLLPQLQLLQLPARASTSHESQTCPPIASSSFRPLYSTHSGLLTSQRQDLPSSNGLAITRLTRSNPWLSRKDQSGQSAR